MLTMLSVMIGMAFAVAVVVALLRLSAWSQRARDQRVAYQVAVTDAIHRTLGAVAAPQVERGRGGTWQIVIAVPFDRPALIEQMLAVACLAISRAGAKRFRFVLNPRSGQMGSSTAHCSDSAHTAPQNHRVRAVSGVKPFEHSQRGVW